MKKIVLSTLLMFCAIFYAGAQTEETCTPASVSHWSIGIKAGTNYFRANPTTLERSDRMHMILGGTLEYDFNPLTGIGIELMNNPYGGDITSTRTLDANTFDILPYASFNLTNLLLPWRSNSWRKWNVFSETGAGVGFYHYSMNNAPNTNAKTLLAKVGLNAEYNISKTLALGLEGQYRYYDRATMGGQYFQKGYCEGLTASIGLRIKLGANNKQHARNISMCEYNPKPQKVDDMKALACCQDAANNLKNLEQSNAEMEQKLQDLENQLNALKNAPKPTPAPDTVSVSFQTIEFGFDSSKLTESSFSILDHIADVLNSTNWTGMTIYGNADSTGPASYNQNLSVKRANTVKNYLVKKDLPSSKMNTVGNGERKPITTNATREGRQKNRRVDFEITK